MNKNLVFTVFCCSFAFSIWVDILECFIYQSDITLFYLECLYAVNSIPVVRSQSNMDTIVEYALFFLEIIVLNL
jgi:hypothetical protein